MARYSFLVTANLVRMVACIAVCLACTDRGYAQECPDPAPESRGSHSFRRVGETFDIPISIADCQAIALELRWSNGRNNGSLFKVTFLDSNNRTLYTKRISGFMSGAFEFPLTPLDFLTSPGLVSVVPVPAMVTIQAVPPFTLPVTLSYTVTRVNRNPRPKLRGIDSSLATMLQSAPGRLLLDSSTYTLTEVALNEPRELEIRGKKKIVDSAFRLMLKDVNSNSGISQRISKRIELIWIDEAPLPVFRTSTSGAEVGTLIYDAAVLRDGGEVSVSNQDGSEMYSLPERINYQSTVEHSRFNVKTRRQFNSLRPGSNGETTEKDAAGVEGNLIVGIRSAVRVIGATRQPLVQIEMTTSRPFPTGDSALKLRVGKRFFVNELSGDHTGRMLTLTLTPEMFAELREDADVVAFYNRPDHSRYSGEDVWYFGRLRKEMLRANR